MVSHDPQAPFEERSKALFDESVDNLDGHVRSRLTQARHRALEQTSHRVTRRVWLPAAGLTAAAVAAVVVVLPRMTDERAIPGSFAAADDMAMLLNGDDFELLEEMEFYAWMDDSAETGAADASGSDARS